jgi:hypothetical protein
VHTRMEKQETLKNELLDITQGGVTIQEEKHRRSSHAQV